MRRAWQLIAGQRDFQLLLIAGVISGTGDWVLNTGLAYYVYRLTGSTLASGTMMLAVFVPQVVLGPVAGVVADRWNRRLVMVAAELLMAVGLLPLLLVHRSSQVWIIYLTALWGSAFNAFFTSAQSAAVPDLVGTEQLTAANGMNGQVQGLARLFGAAVGGVLVEAAGLTGVAVADAASFAAGALLITGMTSLRGTRLRADEDPAREGRRRREWLVGIELAIKDRMLRLMLVFIAVTWIGEGVMFTLMAPFVRAVLHGSGTVYGGLLSLQAVGGIIGGVAIAVFAHRLSTRMLVGVGSLLLGFVDLLLFLYPLARPVIWPAAVLIVLAGLPSAGVMAGYTTAVQVNAGENARGRVFGAFASVAAAACLVGIIVSGVLGDLVGIVPVIAAQGAGYVLVGVLLISALRVRPGGNP
jgi:Na+/melibiose symporter-like transporter